MARLRIPAVPLVVLAAVILAGAGADASSQHQAISGTDDSSPAAIGVPTGVGASASPDRPKVVGPSQVISPAPRPTRPVAVLASSSPARQVAVASTPTKPPAGCPEGEYQRDVERYLAALGGFGPVTVDGRQSAADCLAIKEFQQRYGIHPAAGRAGPTTVDVARRLATTRTADCAAGSGTTVCVNLTLQTVWVIKDGQVVMPPTVTRTGMRGYATPTGTFTINRTNRREWSIPYRVWLPYWQHFIDGIGFHETTTYLHNPAIGSHGCVNLLHADAVTLWHLGGVGTRVHVFGHRPGS